MAEIYGTLDEGIKDVVMLLRENGVDTFASCQGGDGHTFIMPTVRIDSDNPRRDEKRIAKILLDNGYSGFYCGLRRAYASKHVRSDDDNMNFIEVEFWVSPVVAVK